MRIDIAAKVLDLLLLHLLNALAAEILKISEAPIVLDIIYHRCQVLLLRGTDRLVHDVQMRRLCTV